MDNIIQKNDMEQLEKIAEKYDMSLKELCSLILKTQGENSAIRCNVRFSDEEIEKLDKAAAAGGYSRSNYCGNAFKSFIDSNSSLDIIGLRKDRQTEKKRTIRVCIYFEKTLYNVLRKTAKEYGVPYSSLVRFLALNQEDN